MLDLNGFHRQTTARVLPVAGALAKEQTQMLPQLESAGDPTYTEWDFAEPLYRSASTTAAVACLALGYVWLFVAWTAATKTKEMPAFLDVAAPALIFLAAGGALLVHDSGHARLGNAILCAGAVSVLYLWPGQVRYLLAAMVVCEVGLLLGRRAAVLVALAVSVLPGLPFAGLLAVWATAALFWIVSGYIEAALAQASDRQARAMRLERELLQRRGELRQLNDSLRNAYTLLERTNHELAQARDEAEDARRLKMQFASSISHELRTPLNLILGFTEVMYKTPESYVGAVLTPDLSGDIREIHHATAHLLELVDDVLDLSRVEQVRLALLPEETDVLALVGEAVSTVSGLYRGKPVELVLSLPPSLPPCTVDRTRIRQVLINLLTNAARFTEQGEVRVSATDDRERGEVSFSVSDTGRGISPESVAHLFEPFYQEADLLQRRQGGSGLGLAICKSFVQMHGGRMWVESELGKGSAFHFALPTRFAPRATESDWRLPGADDPFGGSIVALDPEGKAVRLLSGALSEYRVHTAVAPVEVAALVERWHPKAVVAFEQEPHDGDPGATKPVLTHAGLPLVVCRRRQRQAVLRHKNVRAVMAKPVGARELLEAVDRLGPVHSLLMADDDEGMTRLVERTLHLARPSTRFLIAHDGKRALQQLQQARPDAMILDLAMPVMDGLSVLDAMEGSGLARLPVLVLTAMDIGDLADGLSADEIAISSCSGLSGAEVMSYIGAVAGVSRPRYAANPLPATGGTVEFA